MAASRPSFAAPLLALLAVGCGANPERYAPPSGASVSAVGGSSSSKSSDVTKARSAAAPSAADGLLEITASANVQSYLGALHAVVKDSKGRVVAGADGESNAGAVAARQLAIVVPAGVGYRLELVASTEDAAPTTCRASVSPVGIEPDEVARVQVFSWDCGDATGYVPVTVESECYWLADWISLARESAPVGEAIQLRAAGNAAHFTWSTPSPELGNIERPNAASSELRCRAAGELPIILTLDDGACQQHLTQNVACR